MNKIAYLVMVVVSSLTYSCIPVAPTSDLKSPAVEKPAPVSRAEWEQQWERAVTEAKKEGSVSVYSIWPPETRTALQKAFKSKFGIDVEFTHFARGADLLARLQQEKRAGLSAADILGAGTSTLILTVKPADLLAPVDPFLILPEVKDPKLWSGDKFPFLDKDKTAVGMLAAINRYVVYNTSMIEKGEITAYKDVLNPRYKGRMTLNDPAVTGAGSGFLSHLAYNLWSVEEAKDFLRQLIQEQKVVIERDNRLHVESVARGKYAIGLGAQQELTVQFIKAGAPIDAVFFKEGTVVNPAAGAFAVPTTMAHSNAAKVFINWLLTKEGQTAFNQSLGIPSLRTDVSTEGFHPLFLVQPGEKIFLDEEGIVFFRGKMLAIAKEIVDAYLTK